MVMTVRDSRQEGGKCTSPYSDVSIIITRPSFSSSESRQITGRLSTRHRLRGGLNGKTGPVASLQISEKQAECLMRRVRVRVRVRVMVSEGEGEGEIGVQCQGRQSGPG